MYKQRLPSSETTGRRGAGQAGCAEYERAGLAPRRKGADGGPQWTAFNSINDRSQRAMVSALKSVSNSRGSQHDPVMAARAYIALRPVLRQLTLHRFL